MVERAQTNLDTAGKEIDVLADKGYHSGREIKFCESLNARTFISPKESGSLKRNPAYCMDRFDYNEHEDNYVCPSGEKMETNGKWYNKNLKNGKKSYKVKHYMPKTSLWENQDM